MLSLVVAYAVGIVIVGHLMTRGIPNTFYFNFFITWIIGAFLLLYGNLATLTPGTPIAVTEVLWAAGSLLMVVSLIIIAISQLVLKEKDIYNYD